MTADPRETVLHAIRSALGERGEPSELPPYPSCEGSATRKALVETFCSELQALGGKAIVVADIAACGRAIEEYARACRVTSIGVQSSELAAAAAAALKEMKASPVNGLSAAEIERLDCSLLEARALLADTGSALVLSSSYEDRLLPYFPRTCMVVGTLSRLYETLSSESLAPIAQALAAQERGEALIVSGPSRTADIEKTLVLGAHGPANLAVFLMP